MSEKKIYAKDCNCSDCKKQAEVFFPCFDPDIPSYPYCKSCANKRREKLMMELLENDRKYADKKGKREFY